MSITLHANTLGLQAQDWQGLWTTTSASVAGTRPLGLDHSTLGLDPLIIPLNAGLWPWLMRIGTHVIGARLLGGVVLKGIRFRVGVQSLQQAASEIA